MRFSEELQTYKRELVLSLGERTVSKLARPLSKVVDVEKRPTISTLYAKLSTIFTTTYLVEQTFSTVTMIKGNKYRSQLKIDILDSMIRCDLETDMPDVNRLLKKFKQLHPSH